MPRRHPMARAERIARVELELSRGTLNARALAAEYGVSEKTIRNDRDAAIAAAAVRHDHGAHDLGTREERRSTLLEALRSTRAAALEEDRVPFAAVATLLSLESKILGLDVPPAEPGPAPVVDAGPFNLDTARERQLEEIRGMRLDAQARGSMVSAVKLLQMEHETLASIDAARREKAEREAKGLDAEALIDRLLRAVDRMPRGLAVQLHAALSQALEPAEAK